MDDDAAGSRPEWDEFVATHSGLLHGYAVKQLVTRRVPASRLQAEDVVNHTIAEVLSRWDSIEQPERYMYTVARNFVLRAAIDTDRFTGTPVDTGDSTDDPEDAANRPRPPAAGWVAGPTEQAAVDRLIVTNLAAGTPAQQRNAVFLVEGLDASRKEAAIAMGVATDTVSTHRDRGLKRMQQIAAECGLFTVVILLWGGIPAALAWLTIHLLRHYSAHPVALPHWIVTGVGLLPAAFRLAWWIRSRTTRRHGAAIRIDATRIRSDRSIFRGSVAGRDVNIGERQSKSDGDVSASGNS